jgi:hypothetical protein
MKPLLAPAGRNLRIWHVGNWCAHWGNEFRESAFRSSIKDFEVLNYARYLVRALEKIPGAQVSSIPSWELYRMSPEQFAEVHDRHAGESARRESRRNSSTDRRQADVQPPRLRTCHLCT